MGTRTEIADRLSRHRDLVKVWGRWDPEWDTECAGDPKRASGILDKSKTSTF